MAMNAFVEYVCLALGGYLVGSIPFGYLVARFKGIDITQHGSGNIGATNVGRLLGRGFGILVFCLDFAKGAVPAALAMALANVIGPDPAPVPAGVAAGLAAILGHLFSVFLRFRGGKGVATGAGVVFVLLPVPTLAALVAWVVVVCSFRVVSLASLAAAAVLCGVHLAIAQAPFAGDELILTIFSLVAVGLVFLRHQSNIGRLVRGTENTLADRPAMQLTAKIIHVLAVGLWFGMAVFFSFPVALTLFSSFETEAEKKDRPTWFPLPAQYKRDTGIEKFNLQKDQGTRAAGFAISPLFQHYFLWQGICGLLATVTALGWPRAEQGRRVHRIRVVILVLAVVTVLLAWPIEQKVSALRHTRNETSDLLMELLQKKEVELQRGPESSDTAKALEGVRAQAVAARNNFAMWHLWSLLLNMVTIGLVTVAMAQTALLPESKAPAASPTEPGVRDWRLPGGAYVAGSPGTTPSEAG
jgi:acyl-phosphate glycerol 3-phosphate acyltransferase